MNADKTKSISFRLQAGGLCLEFSGLESGEIGGGGAFEAEFSVDGGVDLVIRKSNPSLVGTHSKSLISLSFRRAAASCAALHVVWTCCRMARFFWMDRLMHCS